MSDVNSASDNQQSKLLDGESYDQEGDLLGQGKTMFDEHKGKLAIGVAATLGVMIFYGWRERQLAKEDPEEYARIKKLKAIVRSGDQSFENETSPEEELPVEDTPAHPFKSQLTNRELGEVR